MYKKRKENYKKISFIQVGLVNFSFSVSAHVGSHASLNNLFNAVVHSSSFYSL